MSIQVVNKLDERNGKFMKNDLLKVVRPKRRRAEKRRVAWPEADEADDEEEVSERERERESGWPRAAHHEEAERD